jgi:hypothetical protein
MKKLFIAVITILSMQVLAGQVLKAKTLISAVAQPEQIKADGKDVTAFIKKWYIMETNISSMKIEKKNKRYILLAFDSKNNQTLATRLMIDVDGLYITAQYNLYGCECNCMELSKFKMINNKITGCTVGDLTIATAY